MEAAGRGYIYIALRVISGASNGGPDEVRTESSP